MRRIDIDILRAIAVLAVIFFHFDVPAFGGGFLGVDMFFVISGYLITLHVQEELSASRFSFSKFYLRRIRRLFPALFATMVLTSVAALFILPKSLLQDFSLSQIATSLYASNIYFWSVANYFDTDSIVKPLLHTWSLSVEEQFYLVWPLFLLLTFRRIPKAGIVIVGLLSLVAAEMMYETSPSATFYLFPFRIFEFSIGAVACGWAARLTLNLPTTVRNLLLIASSTCIVASLLMATENTPNPGVLTLPLCLGTALIIGLHHSWFNQRNAVTKVLQRIGLLSYSAYLVHWPLLVFYKVLNPGTLSTISILSLLAATYFLAEVFYNFVEQTTARMDYQKYKSIFIALLPLTLILSLLFHWLQPIVYKKLNPNEFSVKAALDNLAPREISMQDMRTLIAERRASGPVKDGKRILVTGDSHAGDIAQSLRFHLAETNIRIILLHSTCDPLSSESIRIPLNDLYENHRDKKLRNSTYCNEHHATYLKRIAEKSPDLVIFSEAWRSPALAFLEETVRQVKEATSAQVLLLGAVPQFEFDLNITFQDLEDIDDINRVAWERRDKSLDGYDAILRKIAFETGSQFISKYELVCPKEKCRIYLGDAMGYVDRQHWTVEGSKYYGQLLIDSEGYRNALQ